MAVDHRGPCEEGDVPNLERLLLSYMNQLSNRSEPKHVHGSEQPSKPRLGQSSKRSL